MSTESPRCRVWLSGCLIVSLCVRVDNDLQFTSPGAHYRRHVSLSDTQQSDNATVGLQPSSLPAPLTAVQSTCHMSHVSCCRSDCLHFAFPALVS